MVFLKVAFPESTWRPVFAKTGGRCTYCGKELSADEYGKCQPIPPDAGAWEVDHWIPVSWIHGDKNPDVFINLWPACCGCNDEKGDRVDGEVYVLERINQNLLVNQSTVDALVLAASKRP